MGLVYMLLSISGMALLTESMLPLVVKRALNVKVVAAFSWPHWKS